jgi:hypothetical protein
LLLLTMILLLLMKLRRMHCREVEVSQQGLLKASWLGASLAGVALQVLLPAEMLVGVLSPE